MPTSSGSVPRATLSLFLVHRPPEECQTPVSNAGGGEENVASRGLPSMGGHGVGLGIGGRLLSRPRLGPRAEGSHCRLPT